MLATTPPREAERMPSNVHAGGLHRRPERAGVRGGGGGAANQKSLIKTLMSLLETLPEALSNCVIAGGVHRRPEWAGVPGGGGGAGAHRHLHRLLRRLRAAAAPQAVTRNCGSKSEPRQVPAQWCFGGKSLSCWKLSSSCTTSTEATRTECAMWGQAKKHARRQRCGRGGRPTFWRHSTTGRGSCRVRPEAARATGLCRGGRDASPG